MPEAVRVELLGGFRVSVGSRVIEEDRWQLSRAASLVKLLALAQGHRLHREEVMALLWPELDAEAAANNLRQALHLARHALELTVGSSPEYLRRRGDLLELCPSGPLWIDVEAFEEAAAEARRSRDPGVYRAALDLYAGELLPQDRYERWVEQRREGLQVTYLTLLLELANLYEEHGETEKAISTLWQALAAEPAQEEAHVGLMRLYARSGRRDDALRQYERLRKALSEELGAEPAAASRRLHEEIVAGHAPRSPRAGGLLEKHPRLGNHNLPAARSSFVGRRREVLEVKRALAMTRLMTLTGVGGSGKSRLALKVAEDLVGAYPDGVWLVELAPLSEGELLPQAVASALGVREQPGRPLADTLADTLSSKQLLLVLDNCEHLIDACARFVDAVLASCPQLRILTTSREALRVAGETKWRVPSLSLPDADRLPGVEGLARYEAVTLFVERARSRLPSFELTPENVRAVVEVCRNLNGIPLAIELAAARITTLTAEQMAARLGDSLSLLTLGSRTAPSRHYTLRATLEWSHDLLSEPEQKLLGRLSVFAGGWTLEAAEKVAARPPVEADQVLDLLSSLVDKSLVEAEMEKALQYRLLEPVRQYAWERLEERGETEATRRRHALWYLALAEEAAPKLDGAEQADWLKRLEAEHDNLRVALQWFLERRETELGLRLAGALANFWRMRSYLSEGLRWMDAALKNGEDTSPTRARTLAEAGWISWQGLHFERATALSEEALAQSRKLGDKKSAAMALHNLGMVAIYDQMRPEEARKLFEESLTLWRELGDPINISRLLQRIGLVSVVGHDFERAAALYEESLALARKAGDKQGVVLALWLGALASLGRNDHAQVRALCKEGLDLSLQLGNMHAVVFLLHVMAASTGSQGQAVRSARLWGATDSLAANTLNRAALGPAERHFYRPYIVTARGQVDEGTWEAAWEEGRTMTPEEAVDYALSSKGEAALPTASAPTQPATDESLHTLTRRQQEIVRLVARGLTNRRIAEELVVSERTVETHVSRILKKLGFRSRAQLAARAAQLPSE